MTTVRHLVPGALLATALAVATAACGSSGTTPSPATSPGSQTVSDPLAGWSVQRIMQQAQTDTIAAPYVRVTGSVSDSGKQVALDLTMVAGVGCRGTVTETGLGSFALISKGSTVWVKPDAEFYKNEAGQNPDAQLGTSLLAGKYLEDQAGSGLGSLSTICSLHGLLGSTSQPSADAADTTEAGTATVGGQRALKLVNAKQRGSAYVTDTTKPEILQIAVAGSSGGSLGFTYYATAPAITPPPASEVVDGSKYGF